VAWLMVADESHGDRVNVLRTSRADRHRCVAPPHRPGTRHRCGESRTQVRGIENTGAGNREQRAGLHCTDAYTRLEARRVLGLTPCGPGARMGQTPAPQGPAIPGNRRFPRWTQAPAPQGPARTGARARPGRERRTTPPPERARGREWRQAVQKLHQRMRTRMPMAPIHSTGNAQGNSARTPRTRRGAGSSRRVTLWAVT
jgi:hypothetical protein